MSGRALLTYVAGKSAMTRLSFSLFRNRHPIFQQTSKTIKAMRMSAPTTMPAIMPGCKPLSLLCAGGTGMEGDTGGGKGAAVGWSSIKTEASVALSLRRAGIRLFCGQPVGLHGFSEQQPRNGMLLFWQVNHDLLPFEVEQLCGGTLS